MKTATVREVQRKLIRVLACVRRGEVVTITKHGKTVAKLVPAVATADGEKTEWPDFAGRMRRLFPKGPPSGKPTSAIAVKLREERA